MHLPAGNHAGFINDQNPPWQRALRLLIFQQPRNSHRVTKADFLQFVNGTTSRGNSHNLCSGFPQRTVNFTERCRLAGSGCSSDVDCQVSGIKNCLDCPSLLVPQLGRRFKVPAVAESVVSIQPVVDHRHHIAFPEEARLRCDLVTGTKEISACTFSGEDALKSQQFHLSTTMSECLSENLVFSGD